MIQHKHASPDEGHLSDDLDVFEEFEVQGGAEEVTMSGKLPRAASREEAPQGEDAFPGLDEEQETTERASKLVASAHDVAPEVSPPVVRTLADELAELAPDVPVTLVAVVGKATVSVGDLIRYRVGQAIDLGRAPGETVDLVANGRLIARGELVEMDGKMGVRILKLVR